MFCYKCGVQVDTGETYCHNCGVALTEPVQTVAAVAQPVTYVSVPDGPSVEEKTKACIKKSLGSPLLLIATIVFAISVILSFVSFWLDTEEAAPDVSDPGIFDRVAFTSAESDTADALYEVFDVADAGLVWVVGLIITFAFARSKGEMKTGGLTTIKIAAKIDLIFGYIFAIFLAMDGMASTVDMSESLISDLIFVAPLFLAIAFLIVFFYHKVRKCTCQLYDMAVTGVPVTKLPGFIGVGCFAIATGCIFVVEGSAIEVIYALSETIAYLLFGIQFCIFNSKIKKLHAEYNTVNVPQPTYQTIIIK